jgi:hypothetical protein
MSLVQLRAAAVATALAVGIWSGPAQADVVTFDSGSGAVVGDEWVEAGTHWYAVSPIDGSHSVDVTGGAFNLTAGSRLYFFSDTPYGHLFSFDVYSESPSEVAWSNPLTTGPRRGIFYPLPAGHFTIYLAGDFPAGYPHQGELFWLNFKDGDFSIDNVVFDAIPEPATWTLMILGFGLAGAALRRQIRTEAMRCPR